MEDKHSQCPLCGEGSPRPMKGYYERHGLVSCQGCGFVFMERIPTDEELKEFYREYSYSSEKQASPVTLSRYNELLDEMEKYRSSGRILDVGCGMGWFLEEAMKRGWEAYGTEFSKNGVEICREKGIQMVEGDLEDLEAKGFDVISSFEVIEHIHDPNEHVAKIRERLRKGGLLYVTTPNFNSLMRYYLKADYNVIGYPEHLSYYTRSTLNKLMKQHSLRPVRFLSTGISIDRFRTSKKKTKGETKAGLSSDEGLRKNIEEKWHLSLAKKLANRFLTLTDTGLTLKGYYVKE